MVTAVIILSIICVCLLGLFLMQSRSGESLRGRLEEASEQASSLREEKARLEARAVYAEKQLEMFRSVQAEASERAAQQQSELMEQSESRFRLLANELMARHSEQLATKNHTDISSILLPLKEDIERFRRDVTTFYSKESAERFSLQERIKDLIESNNSVGREARQLSTALKGNSKVQGDWGEIVLENILESSGLRRGEEFEIQSQRNTDGSLLKNQEGQTLRPDVVVKYPGGKVVVIDSKVSLTAFLDYVNCDDEQQRKAIGKQHVASVVKHINELSEKNYQAYVGDRKLDFVMMFIPNESAYSAAMTLDPSLWQKAYDKRVLVVSPTQLVASLKIVAQLWNQDRQTRNAIDIAERSGAMYDKFVGFVADMEKIERSLTTTRTAYDAAMKKLRDGTGSLIVRAEKLRELGAKAAKRLPSVGGEGDVS